ncbi:MAG: GNAT family N-acetyltransferase [Actinobacteria bacterium]|nr:MAG: GNAT family N-acetyltransferase [Actinomycetota bacterium]
MSDAARRPTAWRAGIDEAETVARLLVGFRDELGQDRPSENAFLAGVERLIEGLDADFLLASPGADSPPAGVAQLRYRFGIWRAAPECWLEDLYVASSARRRGVGTALVEAALARAAERGCRRIELDVSEHNAAALALYERYGFSADKHGEGRHLFLGLAIDQDR